MKIMIIIDETTFFHPDYLDIILQKNINKSDLFKIGIVRKIPKKNSLSYLLFQNIFSLSLREILLLNLRNIYFLCLDWTFPSGINKNNFSVKGVCKKHNIDFFFIDENINSKIYIDTIKKFNPNILVSSNSLIFGQKILSLENIFFVNRHTSLLPSYKGLMPVIHAIINHESKIGVSIHKMTKDIDKGDVIGQEVIMLRENRNLFSIYKIAFEKSAYLTLKVIDEFRLNKISIIKNDFQPSSFSFPTMKELRYFKKIGGRFI